MRPVASGAVVRALSLSLSLSLLGPQREPRLGAAQTISLDDVQNVVVALVEITL